MAVATGFITLVDGNVVEAAELNSNFTILKNSVNNIVSSQITDGEIVNADISDTAEIAMSKITATASDAKLSDAMENFIQGCWLNRSSDTAISVEAGTIMINGELRRNTSATSNSPTQLDAGDWSDVYAVADTAASTFTLEVVDSGTSPGGSSPSGTNTRLIGSIKWDATQDLNITINYRQDKVVGWGWKVGDATTEMVEVITHGVTFDAQPIPVLAALGRMTTVPGAIGDFGTSAESANCFAAYDVTTTAFTLSMKTEVGVNWSSAVWYGFTWVIYGSYS